MQSVWRRGVNRARAKVAVDGAVSNALANTYKKVRKTPDDYYEELKAENTTHFSDEELERLLASYKRVTADRLQATHFYEVVEYEMGWTNLLLRKQLFKAFDLEGHGDITFTEFCEGYSTMLRGTVPELLEFAWRVYHVQGDPNLLSLTDMYTILRLALAGLEEVRRTQGNVAGGITEETRFPERSARQLLEAIFGDRQTPLSKQDFGRVVLQHRKLVDCIIPGFELIPQDPLHRAAEAGETEEVLHLLEVDQLDPNGEDALSWPTTPLHLAARYGHTEVASALLENGANVRLLDKEGRSPLDVAVRYGRLAVVNELLRYGADVLVRNADGSCPIHTASQHGQYKILRELMPVCEARAADLKDKAGDTPLHCCAVSDNWMCMEVFLEFGRMTARDVDERGAEGRTPLAAAAGATAFRMCRRLLDMGADPNATDVAGRSVLLAAAGVNGNEAVVNLLLSDARTMLELADENGGTPITAAVRARDIRILRSLLQAGASPNCLDAGTLYTPLHHAVLGSWLEGVDALLGPGVECAVTRDAAGCTPLDYCRSKEVQELVHEYIESVESGYHAGHPVTFDFALVFYEGRWVTKVDGDGLGHHELKRRKVSKSVAAKRIAHGMVDKDSIKRLLRKAGLFVLEEKVLVQRRALGVIKTDVEQYAFLRVGAPLYRMQLEAQKMRLKLHHLDLDRVEDFYVDEASYPATGFEPFNKSERQAIILSILQSSNAEQMGLVVAVDGLAAAVGKPVAVLTDGQQPFSVGLNLALYKKYDVLYDFLILHDAAAKAEVVHEWDLKRVFTRRFWGRTLMEYFSESRADFRPLTSINNYFGPKIAFYLAYLSFYTNWMFGPAVAGVLVFGLQFIPSEFASMIDNTAADDARFDDQYDHPMMFLYAFFVMVWLVFTVRGWYTKQAELAHRWRVETYSKIHVTANPMSTAPPRMQFTGGQWVYKPVNSRKQRRERMVAMWLVSVPTLLAALVAVAASVALTVFLVRALDVDESLHVNFGAPNVSRNARGSAALYAIMTLNAVLIWLLNNMWAAISLRLTKAENHETLDEFEDHLAYKTLVFQVINGYSTLFYFAYIETDIDKTAATLAAIVVVGQLLTNLTEYALPWMLERSQRVAAATALLGGRSRKKDAAGPDEEEGGKGLLSGKSGDHPSSPDVAETLRQVDSEPDATGARREITCGNTYQAVELSEMIVQFGFIALFGFTWPLAALAVFINNFIELRLDVWKFCTYARRPMAQRARGLGRFWSIAFECVAILGIVNTCLILAFSTNTMSEYFFPNITPYQRATVAFATENVFLLAYVLVRLWYLNVAPSWVEDSRKEALRYIRDAYRAGCALRERRYRLLAVGFANDEALASAAASEDIEEAAAHRYLTVVRYVDGQPTAAKQKLLLDSTTTVPSLLTAVQLRKRNHVWTDPGEAPTAAALLRQIMPVMDLKESYRLGKLFREAVYAIWEYQRGASVLGSKAATIMYLRQFAAIEVGITMPQAERYCRLVRLVDAMEGNPYDRLFDLAVEHPGGLAEVLAVRGGGLTGADQEGTLHADGGVDEGEPAPSELGPWVEPVTSANRAFRRADYVRRRMYERWTADNFLSLEEMVNMVAEELGLMHTNLHRYLLIKRYCDSLSADKAAEVLEMSATETLYLVSQVRQMVQQGLWLDVGEPSFFTYVPPIVQDS